MPKLQPWCLHSIFNLGFNYSIRIVADGNYGSYNKANKSWNGMIGELLNQVLVLNILKFRFFIYGALFKHETD